MPTNSNHGSLEEKTICSYGGHEMALIFFWGVQTMLIYDNFDEFPFNSALFGSGI